MRHNYKRRWPELSEKKKIVPFWKLFEEVNELEATRNDIVKSLTSLRGGHSHDTLEDLSNKTIELDTRYTVRMLAKEWYRLGLKKDLINNSNVEVIENDE